MNLHSSSSSGFLFEQAEFIEFLLLLEISYEETLFLGNLSMES